MEALPANIGIFYTFGFPLCSFVICAFFRNSALTDIKEVGIKPQFYPRHVGCETYLVFKHRLF